MVSRGEQVERLSKLLLLLTDDAGDTLFWSSPTILAGDGVTTERDFIVVGWIHSFIDLEDLGLAT
jgi:hypothetical protein